jgi:hypothetical protein
MVPLPVKNPRKKPWPLTFLALTVMAAKAAAGLIKI